MISCLKKILIVLTFSSMCVVTVFCQLLHKCISRHILCVPFDHSSLFSVNPLTTTYWRCCINAWFLSPLWSSMGSFFIMFYSRLQCPRKWFVSLHLSYFVTSFPLDFYSSTFLNVLFSLSHIHIHNRSCRICINLQ